MNMYRVAVESTVLAQVGYDVPSATLEIVLCSGEVYRYFDIPEKVYRNLMFAESHGTFFNAFIKDKYRFSRN
jgi:hypothetical protein